MYHRSLKLLSYSRDALWSNKIDAWITEQHFYLIFLDRYDEVHVGYLTLDKYFDFLPLDTRTFLGTYLNRFVTVACDGRTEECQIENLIWNNLSKFVVDGYEWTKKFPQNKKIHLLGNVVKFAGHELKSWV